MNTKRVTGLLLLGTGLYFFVWIVSHGNQEADSLDLESPKIEVIAMPKQPSKSPIAPESATLPVLIDTTKPPTPSTASAPVRATLPQQEIPGFKWWDPMQLEPNVNVTDPEEGWMRLCVDTETASNTSVTNEDIRLYASKEGMGLDRLHDQPIAIVSTGRVSSKLVRVLLKRGYRNANRIVKLYHRHFRALRYPYTFPQGTRALFMFSDPIGVVLSLNQKILELGCLEATKWTQIHARSVGAKRRWRIALQKARKSQDCDEWRNMMFDEDVLRQHEFLEGYHQSHHYPMMSLRYDGQYGPAAHEALSWYSTLGKFFPKFPKVGQLVSGSLSTVSRPERWHRLEESERQRLLRTYGQLQKMVMKAPPICLWPPLKETVALSANPILKNTTWFG